MEIYINDQVFHLENASEKELAQLIETEMRKQNKLVSHYLLDGDEYYEFEEIVNRIHLGKVEIILKTGKEMVFDVFTSIHQYLERALPEIQSLTDEFYSGVSSETWSKVADLLEGLNWIYQAVQSVQSMDIQGVDIKTSRSLLQNLQASFPELEQAFIDQDALAIADLIQYEMKPILEDLNEELQTALKTEGEGYVS